MLEMLPHLRRIQTELWPDRTGRWLYLKVLEIKAEFLYWKYEFFWRFKPNTVTFHNCNGKWFIKKQSWRDVVFSRRLKIWRLWRVPVLWLKVFFSFLFIYFPIWLESVWRAGWSERLEQCSQNDKFTSLSEWRIQTLPSCTDFQPTVRKSWWVECK